MELIQNSRSRPPDAQRMPRCASVTVSDILELRADGLTECEVWALLSQAVQALQELFLAGDGNIRDVLPVLPSSAILFSCRGRVILVPQKACDPQASKYEHLLAPEYRSNCSSVENHQLWEKMWVYSLGQTLKLTLQANTEKVNPSSDLLSTLEDMTNLELEHRSSVMELLTVIANNCKKGCDSKPISHVIVDMYREVFGNSSQCLSSPEPDTRQPFSQSVVQQSSPTTERRQSPEPFTVNKSGKATTTPCDASIQPSPLQPRSFNTAWTSSPIVSPVTHRRRNPVQRAASRLYRGPTNQLPDSWTKYQGPTMCVGPEFIVRSHEEPRVVHVGDLKVARRGTVTVLLLTGQRIHLTLGPKATMTQAFQVVVQLEQLQDNYLYGLCAIVDGDFVFLPDDLKLSKVAPQGWREAPATPWLLYMRFKYLLPSLRGLRRWETKHLLYLQLRRSILDQQISCSLNDLVILGGLALQAEFGDFSDRQHGLGDYFVLEHYLPEEFVSDSLSSRLRDEHAARRNLEPSRAEELFINEVQRLPEYGHHHHAAKWCRGRNIPFVPLTVSICPDGICLFAWGDDQRKVHERFAWKAIQRLSFDKNYFSVVPHDIGGQQATRYKLKVANNKSLYIFRLASFHHQVFIKLRLELCSLNLLSLQFGLPLENENTTFVVENKVNSLLEECGQQCGLEKARLEKRRPGVKMGTRAFRKHSLSDVSNTSSDAYVIDAKSGAFSMDLHESLPSALAEKLSDLPCQGERLLKKVQIRKDRYGSLGLEVTEGSNGALYVQSVLRMDAELEQVGVGDQVLAVDGVCVVGRGYVAALAALRSTGDMVTVLFARGVSSSDLGRDYLRNIRYETAIESETFVLTDVPTTKPAVRMHEGSDRQAPVPRPRLKKKSGLKRSAYQGSTTILQSHPLFPVPPAQTALICEKNRHTKCSSQGDISVVTPNNSDSLYDNRSAKLSFTQDYMMPNVTLTKNTSSSSNCRLFGGGSYNALEWRSLINNSEEQLDCLSWNLLNKKESEELLEVTHDNDQNVFGIRSLPSPQPLVSCLDSNHDFSMDKKKERLNQERKPFVCKLEIKEQKVDEGHVTIKDNDDLPGNLSHTKIVLIQNLPDYGHVPNEDESNGKQNSRTLHSLDLSGNLETYENKGVSVNTKVGNPPKIANFVNTNLELRNSNGTIREVFQTSNGLKNSSITKAFELAPQKRADVEKKFKISKQSCSEIEHLSRADDSVADFDFLSEPVFDSKFSDGYSKRSASVLFLKEMRNISLELKPSLPSKVFDSEAKNNVEKTHPTMRPYNLMGPKPYPLFLKTYTLRQKEQEQKLLQKFDASAFSLALDFPELVVSSNSCKKEENNPAMYQEEAPVTDQNPDFNSGLRENSYLLEEHLTVHSFFLNCDSASNSPEQHGKTSTIEDVDIHASFDINARDNYVSSKRPLVNRIALDASNNEVMQDVLLSKEVLENKIPSSKIDLRAEMKADNSLDAEVAELLPTFNPLEANILASDAASAPADLHRVPDSNLVAPAIKVMPCFNSSWHSEVVIGSEDWLEPSDQWLGRGYEEDLKQTLVHAKSAPQKVKKVRFLDAVEHIPSYFEDYCAEDKVLRKKIEWTEYELGVCEEGYEVRQDKSKTLEEGKKEIPVPDAWQPLLLLRI